MGTKPPQGSPQTPLSPPLRSPGATSSTRCPRRPPDSESGAAHRADIARHPRRTGRPCPRGDEHELCRRHARVRRHEAVCRRRCRGLQGPIAMPASPQRRPQASRGTQQLQLRGDHTHVETLGRTWQRGNTDHTQHEPPWPIRAPPPTGAGDVAGIKSQPVTEDSGAAGTTPPPPGK